MDTRSTFWALIVLLLPLVDSPLHMLSSVLLKFPCKTSTGISQPFYQFFKQVNICFHSASIWLAKMAMSSSEAKNQELSSPKKKAKVQPNAFVSLQITNSQVREKLKNNQKLMIENDESISKLQVKPETFHLTLMVMKLELKSETLRTRLESASADSHGFLESHFELSNKALEESSKEVSKILSKLNFQFNLDKVSNFGKEVVFVTMRNETEVTAFKEAAERVRNIFQDHGLPSTDSRSASPHVTLFKPSRGNYHIKLQPEVYQHLSAETTNCGTETFHSLQLCSMTHPKQENGYYHVIHEKLLSHASV